MNPTTVRISFVRHGQVHNPKRILYGRLLRFRLSSKGQQQALRTATFLGSEDIDGLYTSPMLRARQTAQAIAEHHPKLAVQTAQELNEVLTPYQGCPETQTESLCGDFYSGASHDFEQPGDVVQRIREFATYCTEHYSGGHVVAVTHGDPIAFFILWAHREPLQPRRKTHLAPLGIESGYPQLGSITTYSWDSQDHPFPRFIRYWAP